MIEYSEKEIQELEEYEIRYRNLLKQQEKLIKENDEKNNQLMIKYDKLQNLLNEEKEQRELDKKNFDYAIDLLAGVDVEYLDEKPEWMLWFEKVRILHEHITPKTADYWRKIIGDIYNHIHELIKKGKFNSIHLSDKQKNMIDEALEKRNLKVR